MASKVKVVVLRTAGTNCDAETAFAFERCGAGVDSVHINRFFRREARLEDYHILAVPGGFTYGDDIISGRILANELRLRLGGQVRDFISAGKLMIGICNGFQVLVRAGILPGPLDGETAWHPDTEQSVSLTYNDSGKFEDRWVHLKPSGRSVWTEGLSGVMFLPVAHAEGKFIPRDGRTLDRLRANGQVVLRYCSPDGYAATYPGNPNGSVDEIAGVTDRTGRILGMMPHPERHFVSTQHPFWPRQAGKPGPGDGVGIFENGVRYVRDHLL
jgi:phosphoribosylformylglycinamidine synthase